MSTGAKSDKNAAYFQAIIPGITHKIAVTNASKQTAAFGEGTTLVRVFTTQDCWILVGSNPTAASVASDSSGNSMFLPGGMSDYIGVEPGQKIAVIQDSAAGSLYVTEAQ